MLLSYCTNVHPAEDLDGVIAQLEQYAAPVRERLGLARLGVGLWLPAPLARRLATEADALERLRGALDDLGLEVRTLNAFPHTGFHAEVVKLAVYEPTWAQRERLDFTLDCAAVLAALLPEGAEGSISTLPLGWREGWTPEHDGRAEEAFSALGASLRSLRERTGRTVRIAVEPEPGCTLDTVRDVVDWLAARPAIDPEYVGVCVDACHLAVSFAEPAEEIRRIERAGLRVVKLQASAALHVEQPNAPGAREALAAFADPVYIHQVRERTAAGPVLAADDLPEVLPEHGALPGEGPWRVHFHVPLHHLPADPLSATRRELTATIRAAAALPYADAIHLDAETYTWRVMPGAESLALDEGIAAELAWLLDTFPELIEADRDPGSAPADGAVGRTASNEEVRA